MIVIFQYIIYSLEAVLAIYAIYTVSYTFSNSFAALFGRKKQLPIDGFKRKFAVLIPAYKEDGVIVSVAKDALTQKYPSDKFDAIVIADSLKEETLNTLRNLPIKLVEVQFEKSTKVKALNACFEVIGKDYDVALILDADNIMDRNCLQIFNSAFALGFKSVQGKRTAKNKNSDYAVLDGISEAINNHIYRKGQNALGFSASLIGSGMAFDYSMLTTTLKEMDSIGGFDRELEVRLLDQKVKTIYIEDAVIYDEKIDNPETFGKQRTRWIAAQYIYLFKYFGRGMKSLFRGDLVYFNSSILRNIQLPRIINLGLLGLWVGIVVLFNNFFERSVTFWLILYSVYLLSFILAIPLSYYNIRFFKSLIKLPQAFIIMVLCFLKIRSASDKFIHTPHNYVGVDQQK